MAKKEFTEQDVLQMLDEEAKNLNIQVIVDQKRPWELWAYGNSCVGFANSIDFTIHMFMESWMNFISQLDRYVEVLGPFGKISNWYRNPEKILRKQIKDLLIHEARHIEQYKYLQGKGIDVVEYMQEHNKTSYLLRKHEIDAYLVQYTGIRLPLKWVLGV